MTDYEIIKEAIRLLREGVNIRLEGSNGWCLL
jgi:hypothetical protein